MLPSTWRHHSLAIFSESKGPWRSKSANNLFSSLLPVNGRTGSGIPTSLLVSQLSGFFLLSGSLLGLRHGGPASFGPVSTPSHCKFYVLLPFVSGLGFVNAGFYPSNIILHWSLVDPSSASRRFTARNWRETLPGTDLAYFPPRGLEIGTKISLNRAL